MSGIQEILVIVGIILAIIFIPRITSRNQSKRPPVLRRGNPVSRFSGRMRLAVIASLLWLFAAAVYFEPWSRHPKPFLYFGLGPVLLGWGVGWVIAGFRRRRR